MTDRLAEQGAVLYGLDNPTSAGVSRLGAAGALQAAIADAIDNGFSSATASRLGGRGRIYALSAASSFSPLSLFASSEIGIWLDPSDLTSMFQDSAGTTAAVVGQPVGLVLDKSQGLVLGPELVTNGAFGTDSAGWTAIGAGTALSVVSGVLRATGAGVYNTGSVVAVATTIGKYYRVAASVVAASTNIAVAKSDSATSFVNTTVILSATSAPKTLLCGLFKATAATSYVVFYNTLNTVGQTIDIDNVSIKEYDGYHATQSTAPARGVLGTSLIDLDGVDDALSAAAGGGGSTGFFLCAAVRVDGGAGANRVIYSDAGTNTGYILRLNTSNQLELAAGNGTSYTLAATTDTLTAGPYVVTAWDDGTNLNVQVNSGTAGTAARPIVSAGNADFRIGKDYGAATGYFNGAIYPMVYVKNGQNVDAADRATVKTYIAGKAGVTL